MSLIGELFICGGRGDLYCENLFYFWGVFVWWSLFLIFIWMEYFGTLGVLNGGESLFGRH